MLDLSKYPNRQWEQFKAFLINAKVYEQNEITVLEAWEIFKELNYCDFYEYKFEALPMGNQYKKQWFMWQDEHEAEDRGWF